MKKSITEVYRQFYLNNVRNLFLVILVVIGALISFLIYNSYDRSTNQARMIIENNKTYLTGLILAGGDDTIRDFLENENRKSTSHFFQFVPQGKVDQPTGMTAIPLQLGEERLGSIFFGIRPLKIIPWMTILMLVVVSLLFTFFMKMALDRASKFLEQNVVLPLKNLSASIQGSSSMMDLSQSSANPSGEVKEVSLIQDAFIEFTGKLLDSEVAIAKTKVARQVAHDIRSPLSALEMISSNLTGLEEEKRLIIRNSINRIRDIANTLSREQRPQLDEKTGSNREITLLSTVVEMMVTEKRYEISKKSNIQIVYDQSAASYGLFANTVVSELKRILSNLMNNAIDAIGEKQGIIEIRLGSSDGFVQLSIIDNGCGMSSEELKKVIENGVSLKRKSGIGLGLTHAQESIQSWGGKLQIDSSPKNGTTVTLSFRQEVAPVWFVDRLNLNGVSDLIILDDDDTIHQMWASKLEKIRHLNPSLKIHHFKDSTMVEKFYGRNFADLDRAIFLMDYELHQQNGSGLDLIEFLGIEKQSILVTSHYEEASIRQRCLNLGVGMIPKSMAGFVNIIMTPTSSNLDLINRQ